MYHKQFIFASSEWVYDQFKEGVPKTENDLIDIANHTSEYALSKLVSEANLRQKYGSGGSTPASNTCGGGGPGNTTNGVPPDYQWYLPSVEANPGDADWDKCNKTGLDLTKTPPSNPNPLQSYYGIYDSAIKKKLEKMISPNVMVG